MADINPSNTTLWKHRPIAGIFLMLLAIALYAGSDAFVKHLMGTYNVYHTCFLRAFFRLIPLLFLLGIQKHPRTIFHSQQKTRHALRLFVNLAYTYAFMLSFSLASLTTVYTISYTSSFFIVLLGAFFLKEKITKQKWIAVIVGLLGICVALQPGLHLLESGAIVVLIGTWLGCINRILMRKLTQTEHPLAITIYPNLLMLCVSAPFLSSHIFSMPWKDLLLFALMGLITSGGQYFVAQSLRLAKASTLASIDYSSLLWVLLLDFFLWDLTPNYLSLLGVSTIICSNLYLIYCTQKDEKKKIESTPLSSL